MKMAKPSEKDIDAGGELYALLNQIDGRFGGPLSVEGPESLDEAIGDDDFDPTETDHLRGLYNSLAKLLRENAGFHCRVIADMCYVVMYEKNQIVDPDSDTLDLHPRFALVEKQRDELLAALQEIAKYPGRRHEELGYAGARELARKTVEKVKGSEV